MCKYLCLKATHLIVLQVIRMKILIFASVTVGDELHLLCCGIPPGGLGSPEDSVLRCLEELQDVPVGCARLNHLLNKWQISE